MHTRAQCQPRGPERCDLSPCRAALRRAALELKVMLGATGGGGPFLGAGQAGLVVLVQPRILMEIAGLHGTAPPRSEVRVRAAGPLEGAEEWLQIDHPDPITATCGWSTECAVLTTRARRGTGHGIQGRDTMYVHTRNTHVVPVLSHMQVSTCNKPVGGRCVSSSLGADTNTDTQNESRCRKGGGCCCHCLGLRME